MKRKLFLAMLVLVCFVWQAAASNIQVTGATLTGQDNVNHTTKVKFTLSWDNAWRYNTGPRNFDAAYVFVKYRIGTGGLWNHAYMSSNQADHSPGTPSHPVTILPSTAGNGGSADNDGVFIYLTNPQTANTLTLTNCLLQWNYGSNSVSDLAEVQIRVYAIEMVYIPTGPFYIGDGSNVLPPSTNAFAANYAGAPSTNYLPWKVTSENAISFSATSNTVTTGVSDPILGSAYTLVANYPKGYKAFWIMKYEVSQRQYMDFFNTLPYETTPRSARNLGLNNSNRNQLYWDGQPLSDMVLNGTSSGDRACNNMCWADACAFADWACMRPMTELEFEKAARGCDLTNTGNPIAIFPVNKEYAWGSTSINPVASITNDNTASEGWGSCVTSNCHYSTAVTGPVRCGIFAAKNCTTDQRRNAGASYYGVMEMSGNLAEMVIIPFSHSNYSTSSSYYCNRSGHAFTNANGDGVLLSTGNSNGLPGWAHTHNAYGTGGLPCHSSSYYPTEITTGMGWAGLKGGSYSNGTAPCAISERSYVTLMGTYTYARNRAANQGFRAVRSAPENL